MKTLEQLETEYRIEKHQEYHKNKNREQYHPIGLVSHQQRIDGKDGFCRLMKEMQPTHFLTFIFNRRFNKTNVENSITYGKEKLHKFHKYIHKKIFGKLWYRPEKVDPEEHMKMVLFPQDITTNLHFHGVAVIRNTTSFPEKVEMFERYANAVWNTNTELDVKPIYRSGRYVNKKVLRGGCWMNEPYYKEGAWMKERDQIVPYGSVDIQTPDSKSAVSWYSSREQDHYDKYENYYISGSQ